MKRIIPFFLASALAISCIEEEPFISRPETSDPPYLVDITYPEPLAEEMMDSPHPTPYKPIIVRSLGTGRPHNWGKATQRKTRVIHYMTQYEPKNTTQKDYESSIDIYGGCTALPRQEVTGRYYVKKINGRSWIVDPEGYLDIYRAVTTFQYSNDKKMAALFASRDNWIKMTTRQLASMGFHGTGGFSQDDWTQTYNASNSYLPMTITPKPNFLSGAISKGGLAIPENKNCRAGAVFYPDFAKYVMQFAQEELKKYKGDKNVLGIMSDNELILSASSVDVMAEMLSLKENDFPGKQAAIAIMEEHGLEPTAAAYKSSPIKNELQDELSGQMAEKYYQACHDAIKAVDPQFLYLGSRLHGKPKTQKSVIQAAGKYCDIITINYYGAWTPALNGLMKDWAEWTDTPVMITEFYTMSDDSGMLNGSGAGYVVQTTLEKGFFYQNFCLALLEAKNCVGWTWFRFIDAETSNQGIYNLCLQPYPQVATLARELNYNAYDLIEYFDKN